MTERTVILKYFAWVREKAGVSEERVTLPAELETVADLIRWQQNRGGPLAEAFANPKTVRVALDRRHAFPGDRLDTAAEIAFFPPVTGG